MQSCVTRIFYPY